MPIYNGIQFIEESVSSIKCQTYKDWELIIGINGHEKNSDVYNIAKKYESDKIKVIEIFNTKGKSEALNEMLKVCKYDWISKILVVFHKCCRRVFIFKLLLHRIHIFIKVFCIFHCKRIIR